VEGYELEGCDEEQKVILADNMHNAMRSAIGTSDINANDIVVTHVKTHGGQFDVPRKVLEPEKKNRRLKQFWTLSQKVCVFPFVYKGQKYESCISLDHSELWCPTAVSDKGVYEPDSMANDICRGGSWKSYDVQWHTVNNERCILPFTHNGKTYYECTDEDSDSKWCATKVNFKGEYIHGSGTWGNCQAEPTQLTSAKGILFDVVLATNSKAAYELLSTLENTIATKVQEYFKDRFSANANGLANLKPGFVTRGDDALFESDFLLNPTSYPTAAPTYAKHVEKTSNALVITAAVLTFLALCVILPCVVYKGYRCECGAQEPEFAQPIELDKVTATLSASGIGSERYPKQQLISNSSGW